MKKIFSILITIALLSAPILSFAQSACSGGCYSACDDALDAATDQYRENLWNDTQASITDLIGMWGGAEGVANPAALGEAFWAAYDAFADALPELWEQTAADE